MQLGCKRDEILLMAMESEEKAINNTIADLTKTYNFLFPYIETMCVKPQLKGRDDSFFHDEEGLLAFFLSDFASLIIRLKACYGKICDMLGELNVSAGVRYVSVKVHDCQYQFSAVD